MGDDLTNPPGKFAATLTIGPKGQIVIPKGARELFGFQPGDRVLLLADVDRGIAIMPAAALGELMGGVPLPFDPSGEE